MGRTRFSKSAIALGSSRVSASPDLAVSPSRTKVKDATNNRVPPSMTTPADAGSRVLSAMHPPVDSWEWVGLHLSGSRSSRHLSPRDGDALQGRLIRTREAAT